MNWSLLGFLALNLAIALTGNALAKTWALDPTPRNFAWALGVGLFTVVSFMLVVRAGGLASGSSIALLLTLMGNIAIGVLFFQETISLGQWIGIVLGCVAACLILNVIKFA